MDDDYSTEEVVFVMDSVMTRKFIPKSKTLSKSDPVPISASSDRYNNNDGAPWDRMYTPPLNNPFTHTDRYNINKNIDNSWEMHYGVPWDRMYTPPLNNPTHRRVLNEFRDNNLKYDLCIDGHEYIRTITTKDNIAIHVIPERADIYIDIEDGFILELFPNGTICAVGRSDTLEYETMRPLTDIEKECAVGLGLTVLNNEEEEDFFLHRSQDHNTERNIPIPDEADLFRDGFIFERKDDGSIFVIAIMDNGYQRSLDEGEILRARNRGLSTLN